MKNFIFNEDQRCINPNRIEGGDKDFWFEIQTACKDGRWYHGHQYWKRGNHFEWDVYLNTNNSKTENEAIVEEIGHMLRCFERENSDKRSSLEVPAKVFKQLYEIMEKCIHPQLTIDL